MGGVSIPTTRWTMILSAREDPDQRRKTFGELLQDYWQPLFVLARRQGLESAAAEDALQGFFLHLLEGELFEKVAPERGRLRNYLRSAFRHYLADLYDKNQAKKRGGDFRIVELDAAQGDRLSDNTSALSPDAAFDLAWAGQLLDRALDGLEEEFKSGKRTGPFEAIRLYFRPTEPVSQQALAEQFDMSISQLRSFLHRARGRYRELLRDLIADTVEDQTHVELELADLNSIVQGG